MTFHQYRRISSYSSLPMFFDIHDDTKRRSKTVLDVHDDRYDAFMVSKAHSDPGINDDDIDIHGQSESLRRFVSPSFPSKHAMLSSWRLCLLTVCLAGTQFVWTVEMGYGTPYLSALGLSKPMLTLAWLAGPLSGLLMQPLVGTWSDHSRSRWGKRRPFIAAGVLGAVLSLLLIGHARSMMLFVGLETSLSDSEPASWPTIVLVVTSFYVLDFAINTIQAACRSLVVDVLCPRQQSVGTSWASAMIGVGNVAGYFIGALKLQNSYPVVGGSQLQVLITIAIIVQLVCALATILGTPEQSRSGEPPVKPHEHCWGPLYDLFHITLRLPRPVQLILHVQFFSWIGWTEYIKQIMLQRESSTDREAAVRAGSLALLYFSFVSIFAAVILPFIGRLCMLRLGHIWSISCLAFALLMFCTAFSYNHIIATVIVGLTGVCWAVAMWVPLSLMGEFISSQRQDSREPQHTTLSQQQSYMAVPDPTEDDEGRPEYDAGVIIGINNAFVVLPQLLASLLGSAVFAVAGDGPIAIEWTWQIGGMFALIAALLARKL